MQGRAIERRTLAAELVDRLRGEIADGAMAPGDRIPTEKELVTSYGVSRTVVREAIARLTAEGYLEPRQGSGVFVTAPPPAAFQVMHSELDDLLEVSRLLELRMAVEAEMAAFAAQRRSDEDVEVLRALVAQVRDELAAGEGRTDADEALHARIALASGNHYFVRFLEFLEVRMVPRRDIVTDIPAVELGVYWRSLHDEHVALVEAIARGDAEQARRAARRHLENAHRQLTDFHARQQGEAAPPA